MNLGLDLQGGVYFLLEVDSDAALRKAVQRYREDVRALLREERIRYRGVTEQPGKLSLSVLFADPGQRDQALDLIQRQMTSALDIEERERDGQYVLELTLARNETRAVQDFAVQQNVLTAAQARQRTRRGRTGDHAPGQEPHRGATAGGAGHGQGQGNFRRDRDP